MKQLKASEGCQKIIDCVSEESEGEVEQKLQNYLAWIQEVSGLDKEQLENIGGEVRRAVEARRRGRGTEREQTGEIEQGKKVSFVEEEERRAESTDEQDAMDGLDEMRTGRGSAGLVRGGDERGQANETSRKGKGKGPGGKGEHEDKGRGFGGKGMQQGTRTMKDGELEKQDRVAPNMGAGGSHNQAISDTAENEGKGER